MNKSAKNQGHFDPRARFADFGDAVFGARRSDQKTDFDPSIYFKNAWEILKQAPLLFVLKLGATLMSAVVWLGVAVVVALPILAVLNRSLGQGLAGSFPAASRLTSTMAELTGYLGQPAYLLGVLGLIGGGWALSFCIHALASAGIWATIGRAIGGDAAFYQTKPISLPGSAQLLNHAAAHFSRVLGLQSLAVCARAVVWLLGAITLISVWLATTKGIFADASVLVRAVVWALPCTLLSGFALLTRLSTEVAAVPLIFEKLPAGRALLKGASIVCGSFVPVYRLFLYAAKLFLLPLVFYWLVAIAQNLVFVVPSLSPLFGVLRVVSFVILIVTSSVIAVFFKAAVFSYYHAAQSNGAFNSHQIYASQMGHSIDHKTTHLGSQNPTKGNMPNRSTPTRIYMTRETTLQDFLPDTYPNIVELSDLIRTPPKKASDAPTDLAENSDLRSPQAGVDSTGKAPKKLSIPTPRELSSDDVFSSDDDAN